MTFRDTLLAGCYGFTLMVLIITMSHTGDGHPSRVEEKVQALQTRVRHLESNNKLLMEKTISAGEKLKNMEEQLRHHRAFTEKPFNNGLN